MMTEEPPQGRRPLHPSPEGGEGPPSGELGEDFGTSALRLAGFCGVVLGWSPDNFWRATPAEVGAVVHALSPPQAPPVDRDLLDRLKEVFPDG